ncbi:ribonucleotide reductase [Stutzerimonas kirkiae]|uniref:Ribonucleotide reductase n=1 Tax=Stutzerimonas kirkiae TaxID=2211392 RepID=A0A4Q9REH2_9GAMM|nr:DUF2388 domain-containing protein [Stutzerimonas kirkiae]TBU99195.1 ribonucleotide reductase [Stutzerimonas kirkiae]TBV06345.1 ribonucleotide reductase [Stutzerimonas kirkiae]
MRKRILTLLLLAGAPLTMAQADGLLRDILSSGATTGSTYLTFKDDKQVVATREDAGTFVASEGSIRGPYLEARLRQLRSEHPHLRATDLELARALLSQSQ